MTFREAFATVRQRVARHLLDLASAGGPELIVTVTQQQLADAAGTVREVVVRVLRDLRTAGVIRTERDRIVIVNPQPANRRAGVELKFLTARPMPFTLLS